MYVYFEMYNFIQFKITSSASVFYDWVLTRVFTIKLKLKYMHLIIHSPLFVFSIACQTSQDWTAFDCVFRGFGGGDWINKMGSFGRSSLIVFYFIFFEMVV